MNYVIAELPLTIELETKAVLKLAAKAHQALAELKGIVTSIPNQAILINTLSLQEAKDSSAIENIITTHDELYRSNVIAKQFASPATKEVFAYAVALRNGYAVIKEKGLLTNNLILEIQAELEENKAGFRKLPGTALKNERTGETVYTPPQHGATIQRLMGNLETFINDDDRCDWDPLVKMAVIHHQFESIHPFYDGNGRTGRIINILYLVQKRLLNTPVLYLSRYINQNKADYYRLLQKVRTDDAWLEWIEFILEGVYQTAHQTIQLVTGIKHLMQQHKHKIRDQRPKIYSQDLLNLLFSHPYTKIEQLEAVLNVSYRTSTRYLEALIEIDLVSKHKIGRESYYINNDLMTLLSEA
ncbi:MAG: Fic family protein [bacterium]|nr:Fic family protein [bacterium]